MGRQQSAFFGAHVRLIAAFSAAFLIVAQLCVAMTHPAQALVSSTVDSLTSDGWSTADTRTNGHVSLVEDATAPLGNGALSLKTDANPAASQDKAQFMMAANVPLATATTYPMYYSTKQISASFVAGLPSYQVAINLLGTSGFTTLVYEPYNNVGNDGVHNGEWQQWNVGEGKFWSTRAVGSLQPSQGQHQYTLAQILAEFPNATILGVGVNIGSNNPAYDTEVDGFAFNDTVYNFDPAPVVPAVPTGLGFTQAGLACGGATNSSSVTLNWSAVANATSYTYHIDKPGGAFTELTVNSTSAAYAFGAEGQYSYKVRANGAGETHSDWSANCTVVYDKTAPTVAFGTMIPFSGSVGTPVTFSGTSSGATSVRVFIGTTDLGLATVHANGNWTITTPVPAMPMNFYPLKAVAQDTAGNTSTTLPWYSFMVFSFPTWW